VIKWQRNWTQNFKGSIAKEHFPNVEESVRMEINLTQNVKKERENLKKTALQKVAVQPKKGSNKESL